MESLVLLKNLFCWTLEDILFLPMHVRGDVRRVSQSRVEAVREQIEAYNYADMELYRYYNTTLWKRIRTQPDHGQFWRDVRKLREMLSDLESRCGANTQLGERYVEYIRPDDEDDKEHCEKYLRHLMTDNIPMKVYNIDHRLNMLLKTKSATLILHDI